MQIAKGDVFFCNLDPTFGHEQAGIRPVVVLQNDIANDKLHTVMVAPLTSNLKAKGYLLTVFVKAEISRLPKDSVIRSGRLINVAWNARLPTWMIQLWYRWTRHY